MPGLTYEGHLRPLLFRFSAEHTHSLAQLAMRWGRLGALVAGETLDDPRLSRDLAGLHCTSVIGLAPGFDKDGRLLGSLAHLGFGYLTIGSITAEPRKGNPRPRLVRYPDQRGIGNSMGLPSIGMVQAESVLRRPRPAQPPVIASVAGFGVEEMRDAVLRLAPYVDGVELGLVCPNSDESGEFGEAAMLGQLLTAIKGHVRGPLFVKLPPYHDDVERARTLGLVDVCVNNSIAGVSVSGTRVQAQAGLAAGHGSMAGGPVFGDTRRIVADIAATAPELAIKASGGVMTGSDAAELLRAGATTVEVYSALIYRGPRVAKKLGRELLTVLDASGAADVRAFTANAESDSGTSP